MFAFSRLMALTGSNRRLRDRGDAARDAGDWGAAATFYATYLQRAPEDAAIWVQLGHARKEAGDLIAAERAYLRALSINLNDPDVHVQLGHVAKLRGHLNDSVTWYRKALELDGNFRPALEELERNDHGDARRAGENDASSGAKAVHHVSEVDRRIELLANQISAVKAVAFEVQRLRRRSDDFAQQLSEISQRLAQAISKSETNRSEIEQRLSSLEEQSPVVQTRFSALVEHFGSINSCRKDLEKHTAQIHELMRARPS